MLVIITSILEDIMDTEKVEKKLFHRMLKTLVAVAAAADVLVHAPVLVLVAEGQDVAVKTLITT